MGKIAGALKRTKQLLKEMLKRDYVDPITKDYSENNSAAKNAGYIIRNLLGAGRDLADAGTTLINKIDPFVGVGPIGLVVEGLESVLGVAKPILGFGSQIANLATTGEWDWRKDGTLPGVNALAEDGLRGFVWHTIDQTKDIMSQNQKPYSSQTNSNYLSPGNRMNLTRPTGRTYGGRPQKPMTQVTRPKWNK